MILFVVLQQRYIDNIFALSTYNNQKGFELILYLFVRGGIFIYPDYEATSNLTIIVKSVCLYYCTAFKY